MKLLRNLLVVGYSDVLFQTQLQTLSSFALWSHDCHIIQNSGQSMPKSICPCRWNEDKRHVLSLASGHMTFTCSHFVQ